MFCKKCGKKLSDNTVICPVCGEPTECSRRLSLNQNLRE
ncbi:MAG: zinc-ribbon domain-containing protein [Ruminococcus sp.]